MLLPQGLPVLVQYKMGAISKICPFFFCFSPLQSEGLALPPLLSPASGCSPPPPPPVLNLVVASVLTCLGLLGPVGLVMTPMIGALWTHPNLRLHTHTHTYPLPHPCLRLRPLLHPQLPPHLHLHPHHLQFLLTALREHVEKHEQAQAVSAGLESKILEKQSEVAASEQQVTDKRAHLRQLQQRMLEATEEAQPELREKVTAAEAEVAGLEEVVAQQKEALEAVQKEFEETLGQVQQLAKDAAVQISVHLKSSQEILEVFLALNVSARKGICQVTGSTAPSSAQGTHGG